MGDLVMPKLGLTMTEGLLAEWRVAAGDRVAKGDVIFTVETEKVSHEIEAESELAITEILVAEGETVPVGTPVARLGDAPPAASRRVSMPAVTVPPASGGGGFGTVAKPGRPRIVATPLARRMSRKVGIELSQVTGSGPRGRIKAADVERTVSVRAAGAEMEAGPQATEIRPDPARLATARRVSAAKRDTPHFYITHEAEVSALMQLRDGLNAEEGHVRITVTHMLVRAMGFALAEKPELNCIWSGDRMLAFASADVGMLTETPSGLRMPMIRDVGRRTLRDITADATALAERARRGLLTTADIGGGAAAISNVGMHGVTSITPIISPPQAMMLGVGAERRLFRPDADGRPALCRELILTLACDHRVIDGADAARFLAAVVALLEDPQRLLAPAHT